MEDPVAGEDPAVDAPALDEAAFGVPPSFRVCLFALAACRLNCASVILRSRTKPHAQCKVVRVAPLPIDFSTQIISPAAIAAVSHAERPSIGYQSC